MPASRSKGPRSARGPLCHVISGMRRTLLLALAAGTLSLAPGAVAAVRTAGAAERPGATVAPPAQPGTWTQTGAAVTSGAGKQLHFYRTVQNPQALGVVVTSTSTRTIRVVWQSYCEFSSDDDQTLEDQGIVTGLQSVIVYPPTFPGATLCYVWVSAGAPGTAKVTAAVFST